MLKSLKSPQEPEVSRSELLQAIGELSVAFSDGTIDQLQPTGPAAVYTSSVTLWMLVMQRLASGNTLNAMVKDFIANRPAFCPQNRRLDEGTLSESSGAYAGARKRIELETIKYLFHRVSDSFSKTTSSLEFRRRQTFLLDGTTITLAPTEELKRHFPPATNQHGESVWPIMLLFVAHDLETGCALFPEVGRMYGGKGDSEALMAEKIVKRLPRGSIAMADAGLGIFRVAWACRQAQQDFLLRLTKSRFDSLTKKATLVENRWKYKVWKLNWQPTARDRKGCPHIPADAGVHVMIHEIEIGDNGEKLYMVTTLEENSYSLADRYRHRYDVETDIKEVKVALDTENIRAKSKEMVLKELYTSLTAYNLLIQFRRQAAAYAGVPARRLSFQEVWNTYNSFLKIDLAVRDPEACLDRYEQALEIASRAKIPERPGRRYQRAAHPRRPKTTKEQKAARKRKPPVNTDDDENPPNSPK
jgi:hypothetical protein